MNIQLLNAEGPTGFPTYRHWGTPFEILVLLDLYDEDWTEWSDDPGSILHDGPNGTMYVDLDLWTPEEETRGDALAAWMRAWITKLEEVS